MTDSTSVQRKIYPLKTDDKVYIPRHLERADCSFPEPSHVATHTGPSESCVYFAWGGIQERHDEPEIASYLSMQEFISINLIPLYLRDAVRSLSQLGVLCQLPRQLSRENPANVIIGGISMGAEMQFDMVRVIETCAETIRGFFELDVRHLGPLRGRFWFFELDVRHLGPIRGRFFLNGGPRIRFETRSSHYTNGLGFLWGQPEAQYGLMGDEAASSRRTLHTTPNEIFRLTSTSHYQTVLEMPWDIAQRLKALHSA
jgi:hypothetical protein